MDDLVALIRYTVDLRGEAGPQRGERRSHPDFKLTA